MDYLLGKVKGKAKKSYFKLLSGCSIFDSFYFDRIQGVDYSPDHNLDEDSFFKIENFSGKSYCLDFLKGDFDSKEYNDLDSDSFKKLAFLVSIQDENYYFQKVTPSLFVQKKMIVFGEVAKIEKNQNRLTVNAVPDAIYFKDQDTIFFKSLATISSIFRGIDTLYKVATDDEVSEFLNESFLKLDGDYSVEKVSKPNRKRLALAMNTLAKMSDGDRENMLSYVERYCHGKLKFDDESRQFQISKDEELKFLLYGIEQRFYTTPFGNEKRLANSVQKIE
ncbi:ATP F0F1 synthase synthase [Marinobacter confluentis]|uniref:ATP F0F1 synthase synthase n=1 Tax=Marinobacter confluentis TaxID=1697557 RepID=A0A4Z1BT11_9GAMM|nr:ATP F0F1 synthase synthase [Marinobacter confluentis]TGN40329.1 ATP F0F1 synthase synthase [Marinobacter confluentis]